MGEVAPWAGGGKKVASHESRVASPYPSQDGEAVGREGSMRSIGGGRHETRDTGLAIGVQPSAIGQKVAGRGSRVAGPQTPLPATPYSPQHSGPAALRWGETLKSARCTVLPRERSDNVLPLDRAKRGSLGEVARRAGGGKTAVGHRASAVSYQPPARKSRVAGLRTRPKAGSLGGAGGSSPCKMECRRRGGVDAKHRWWETQDTGLAIGHRPSGVGDLLPATDDCLLMADDGLHSPS